MAHSYTRNHIHMVFSTKERRNTIPKEMQLRLWPTSQEFAETTK